MQPFYIPAIPAGAEYCSRQGLVETYAPDMNQILNEIQVVDDRWTPEDIQRICETPPRPELAAFFEIEDWHRSSGHFDVLCSMALFGLAGNEERWNEYIDGVAFKVQNFPQKYPSHLFRFYVSPDMWDLIHKRGLMKYRGVDFVKMRHSSQHSRIGTFWRWLGLEDYSFSFAYTDDSEDNETSHILSLDEVKRRLSPPGVVLCGDAYFLREEYDFTKDKSLTDISPFYFTDLHGDGIFIEQLSAFNRLAGQLVVRGEKRLPSLIPLICHYLSTSGIQILYHPQTHRWSSFREREPRLGAGAYGFMNEFFLRFLTKAIRINHLFYDYRHDLLQRILKRYGRDCLLIRLYNQLLAEGHSLTRPGPRMTLTPVRFEEYLEDI